jgi:flagellar protein FlaG
METKFREIQPIPTEAWVKHEPNVREASLVQPVPKGEKGSEAKIGKEEKSAKPAKDEAKSTLSPEETKQVVEEVESYLKDFDIQLDFNIEDKTGDIVVKVLNRETGDVIRQIPPEGLQKLREKLKELRGVLFDGKV